MSEFADNLKKYRKIKGYTQRELSDYLNYHSTAIANYESGRNEPCIDDLITLARLLDVTIDELVGMELSAEEMILLSVFKKLEKKDRQIITYLIDKLSVP